MCGRYTLAVPDWFEHDFGSSFPTLGDALRRPRYNVSPGQMVLALTRPASGGRVGEAMKWGVEAPWKGGPPQMINARAEKLASSRLWKTMLENGRCAIPADGFYEWRAAASKGARKQPIWFSRVDQEPFVFAGLFRPAPEQSEPNQCVIVTVEPNELVEDVHDRMPAMLHPDRIDDWLEGDVEDALSALTPFPSVDMTARAVGTAVGSPRNEGPELIEPLASADPGEDEEQSLF